MIPLPIVIGALLALLLMLVLVRAQQECIEQENADLREMNVHLLKMLNGK